MKVPVKNLSGDAVGELELDEAVFGLEPRGDILHRMVGYQLAKRRAGTHKTKGYGEVRGTTKKPWRQKGTGRARAGSLRAPQFRGGGTVFGPTPRDHSHDLPKKFRKLALKTALSAKAKDGKLTILDAAKSESHKTKDMAKALSALGLDNAFIVDGDTLDVNFTRAVRNLPFIAVVPQLGANVYDILRRDQLVLTQDAVTKLQERLK